MQQVNNKYYNYILFDPRKPLNWSYKDMNFKYSPFYVGKGSGYRCTHHYLESDINKCENPHKTNTIVKLQQGGYLPMYIKFNENSLEENALKEEINLIKYIKETLGDVLTNIQDGGDQPPIHFGSENNKAVYVCRYDKDTGEFLDEWESAADACRYLGVSTEMSKHITQCCKGTRRTSIGFKWSFNKTDKIATNTGKFDRIKFSKLICYNESERHEFSSMKEAYEFLGVPNKGKINSVLKGDRNTYKGYNWVIEK